MANLDARIVANKESITALQGSAITQAEAEIITNTTVTALSKAVSNQLAVAIDDIKAKVRKVAVNMDTRQAKYRLNLDRKALNRHAFDHPSLLPWIFLTSNSNCRTLPSWSGLLIS